MPFDRLPHVTPAAHAAFQHAFERTLRLSSASYEDGFELALEATSDPEWAATQEYRDFADLIHWRMSYFDNFVVAYRKQLGTHRQPLRQPIRSFDVYPDSTPF